MKEIRLFDFGISECIHSLLEQILLNFPGHHLSADIPMSIVVSGIGPGVNNGIPAFGQRMVEKSQLDLTISSFTLRSLRY